MKNNNLPSEFKIFTDKDGTISISATIKDESVWLSLNQLADLFERDKSVISRHIKNVLTTGELEENSVVANFATTAADGKTYQVDYYNLDMILSVGYRINSKRGTQFRQWANSILKPYIIKGYSFNEKKLHKNQLEILERSLLLISRTIETSKEVDISQQAIHIIRAYTHSWRLLLEYDENRLMVPEETTQTSTPLPYLESKQAIQTLKDKLKEANQAETLFGQEREKALEGILGNIEQTFQGISLYQSVEEKAAHLLYFIIKDHPFNDGNKRIGSMLFLLYLKINNVSLEKVNDSTLVALALMIAESDPKEKDLVIKLILNLIV